MAPRPAPGAAKAARPPVAACILAAALLALAGAPAALEAQGTRLVRGVTVDSSTGMPVAGALVEIRSPTFLATDRTDEEGNFRIARVPAGSYRLTVLRIGFGEARRNLEVGAGDPNLTVQIQPVAQRLAGFRVRGDISAIYGMVGTLPDLLPLAGATVQVLGADKALATDSTGGFFIPVNPGTYLVRMTREGYADRIFPIEVPRGRAVDASRMLDPGAATHPGVAVVYKDLDQRMRQRAASNAAIVPGAEIRRAGTNLIDGLRGAQSFSGKGIRIADSACVFVNGMARPGVSLESFSPEEVEAVEVYAQTAGATMSRQGRPATGDRSESLGNAWPVRAPCGVVSGRSFGASRRGPLSGTETGKAFYIVIWLRK